MKRFLKELPIEFIYGILCGTVLFIVVLFSWRILVPVGGILLLLYLFKKMGKGKHQ